MLLMKDSRKGAVPSNYRPITCLPILWKLFTSCIAELSYVHLDSNNLFFVEQKGVGKPVVRLKTIYLWIK